MNKFFGKKLKELRLEKQLTQAQMAMTFNVSKTTICQWETMKQEPSLDDIVAIAIFFDVATDYLLGIEDIDGRKMFAKNYIHNINNHGSMTIK